MKKVFAFLSITCLLSLGTTSAFAGKPGGGGTPPSRDVRVMATNDLGMHCVCMSFDKFMLLPPFNTLRAQVIERDVAGVNRGTPTVLADPTDIRVEYNIVENTDANLQVDPYFQSWIQNAPKMFPGFQPIDPADGKIQGLTGAKLDGQMTAKQGEGWWEVVGVPAYPDYQVSPAQDKVMIDPLGGPDRNPFLTANVKVYDQATGALLAETNTVAPAAFGGCCSCHIDVAANYGFPADPSGSFEAMGYLHARDNGINIAQIDADGDGIPGPIRCSQCHLDPAMGESTPPGYAGYPVSSQTFSKVLHGWHSQNTAVQAMDPTISTNCYQCHPGNNVNCYRGHHVNKTIGSGADQHNVWCTDCHGDLNQRLAEGQLDQPWSDQTLPKCSNCHTGTGEGGGYLSTGIFGQFLNSRAHKNDAILCSTCHGEPHGLNPSTMSKDNAQNIALQGLPDPIGVCDTCHVGRSTSYGKPMH